jgi:hypothetical protein
MTFATVVPEKGSKGKFVADKCLEFFAECGSRSGDIIVKTDQEPAIAFLVKDLVAERGDEKGSRTIVEHSPIASSGSNGVVERAVQTVEGQIRVLKLALEERLGVKVPASSCIVAFLAEYSAYLLNRLEVGKDGKTALERSKGKSASVLGIEFGEKLMYKTKFANKAAKIEKRWEMGIFVGVRVMSGEFWIATPGGIKKCRSVKRLPVQDRWGEDNLKWVRHVPWHLYRGDAGADGDIPDEQLVDPEPLSRFGAEENLERESITVKTRKIAPRAFQIRKEDAEKHGYTRGCAGCNSWFRGLGRQPHTPECRSRFEGLLKDEARFQNAQRRKQEFEEKMRERAVKKQRKEEERGQRRQRERDELEELRAEVQGQGSSSSSSAGPSAGPLLQQPPVAVEGGQMDVEDASGDGNSENREFWGPLLKRIKKNRAEGEMDVSTVREVLKEAEAEYTKRGPAKEDEICEVRAEIIEEIIQATLGNSDTGECFNTLDGHFAQDFVVLSPAGASSFLPDMCGIVDVFGIDASHTKFPEYSSGVVDEFCSKADCSESALSKTFAAKSEDKKRWCDVLENDEDLEKYAREYWREDLRYATDDVNGGNLDLEKVVAARQEEIEFMKLKCIWKEVPISEAWDKTGRAPVTVKWVDTEKAGGVVRCRLVARDFKTKGEKDREDLFAATPPLELLKAQLSRAAMNKKRKVLIIDVKKAHLYPLCEQDVYIELPEEAGALPGRCGKLVHWLYGFRPAAQAWENHYAENLAAEGFVRGKASPVSFYDASRDVSCLVHGDDFTFVGDEKGLNHIEGKMKSWYELKVKARLGPDPGDDKEVDVLNRIIRCTESGYEYEADPKHRRKVMEVLGFDENTKSLKVNGKVEDEGGDDEELQGLEATSFRALAARLNYVSQDSPDLQFAAKEVCREMAKPTGRSWRRLKVLARFMLERDAVVWKFSWQEEAPEFLIFSHSDWAGCRRTRRSTSGGVVFVGEHCLKTWSSTQAPIALSSAEAEYYAMVEGTTRALGIRAMLAELGIFVQGPVQLYSDASAARSFASRRGVGRMRHLETRHLWLQGEVASQRVQVRRVPGEENPADLLTKYHRVEAVAKHLERMSIIWIGRHRKTTAAEGGC